jgi:hypothetical protein
MRQRAKGRSIDQAHDRDGVRAGGFIEARGA